VSRVGPESRKGSAHTRRLILRVLVYLNSHIT